MVQIDELRVSTTSATRGSERFREYANGHLPVHLLAGSAPQPLPLTYLQPLMDPLPPNIMRIVNPVDVRYGRRYDDAVWPDRREDVRLLADITALLTVTRSRIA